MAKDNAHTPGPDPSQATNPIDVSESQAAPLKDVIPPDSDASGQNIIEMKASRSAYSGPLPPPELLKQYDDILPGSAERIMKAFESESGHRHEMDGKLVDRYVADQSESASFRKRGQILGFILALAILLTSLGVILFSKQSYQAYSAAAVAGTTLVAMVVALITGRVPEKTTEEQRPSDEQRDEAAKT